MLFFFYLPFTFPFSSSFDRLMYMLILLMLSLSSTEELFQSFLPKLQDRLCRKNAFVRLQLLPVKLLSLDVEISKASIYSIFP